MLDRADKTFEGYPRSRAEADDTFRYPMSLRRRLFKLRFGFNLWLEAADAGAQFWRGFDEASVHLSYPELARWAQIGLDLSRTKRQLGKAYFRLSPPAMANVPSSERALVLHLFERATSQYTGVSAKELGDALKALKELPGGEPFHLLLYLCREMSNSSVRRAFELLSSYTDATAGKDFSSDAKQTFLVHGLKLLEMFSQKSTSKVQEYFEQMKPLITAVSESGAKGERVVKQYDYVLQAALRLAEKSDYLAGQFFTTGIEIAKLKHHHPVEQWAQLFELAAGAQDQKVTDAGLVREPVTYASMVKGTLSELAAIASREGDESIFDVVLENVLIVARRDIDAGFNCLIASPAVLRRIPLRDFPQWVERGLALPPDNRKGFIAYFGYESKLSHETVGGERGAVALDDILGTLSLYIEGLTGKSFTIISTNDPSPLTDIADGKSIYLPAAIKLFDKPEENFRLYKVLAARAAGQLEFGTYDQDSDELLKLREQLEAEFRLQGGRPVRSAPITAKRLLVIFPQNHLAERLFAILEEARIESRLRQSYRGLRRDLEWARRMWTYRRPEGAYLMGYETLLEAIYDLLLCGDPLDDRVAEDPALFAIIQKVYAEHLSRTGTTVADTIEATRRVYEHLAPKPPEDSSVPWKDNKEVPPDKKSDRMKLRQSDPANERMPNTDEQPAAQINRATTPDEGAKAKVVIESKQPPMEVPAHPDVSYYDEWDKGLGDYRVGWCTVKEEEAPRADAAFVAKTRSRYAGVLSSIRHQFQLLQPQGLRRVGRQVDGDDFDMQAVLDYVVDRRVGSRPSDRIYTERLHLERDVAVLFLVDMSSSTSHYVGQVGLRKIIDVEKEALVLMSEALEAVGDSYAIYGFSSHGRKRITIYKVKGFNESHTAQVERRMAGMKPLVNTRLGAALRHSTARLAAEPHQTRLLIVLTDGEPYDDDSYNIPFYAREDTRRALLEAKRQGIIPFCITVNSKAEEHLKAMYGEVGYTIVDNVLSLPERMPGIYRRLTT